jgi:hypothetical protein
MIDLFIMLLIYDVHVFEFTLRSIEHVDANTHCKYRYSLIIDKSFDTVRSSIEHDHVIHPQIYIVGVSHDHVQ